MWKIKKTILFFGDIALLYISLAVALVFRYGTAGFVEKFSVHFYPFSIVFAFWLLLFYLSDFYERTTLQNPAQLLWKIGRTLASGVVLAITLFYLFPKFFTLTPKTNLVVLGFVFIFFAYGFRIIFIRTASRMKTKLFFVGASPLRKEIEGHIQKHPYLGYVVAQWIEAPTQEILENLGKSLSKSESGIIVATPNIMKDPEIGIGFYEFFSKNIRIVNILAFYEEIFGKLPLESLSPNWFIEHIVTRRPLYDNLKRIIDCALSFFLSLLLLPIMIVIGILIKLTSRGPVFYIKERAGMSGNPFKLFKFRTMCDNADKKGPLWTEKNDNRITPFGSFLRHSHLDEIPQLFNILKGDISFTGPRPERIELADQYQIFSFYEMRHIVKPGITGWAQINYRPSASFEEAREKLCYDLFYVKNRSFFLDTMILIRTIKHFIFPN